MQYSKNSYGMHKSLNVVLNGVPHSIPGSHPMYSNILRAVESGEYNDDYIFAMIDVKSYFGKSIGIISDRFLYHNNEVLLDGDPIDESCNDIIQRALAGGNENAIEALAKFLLNVADNPSPESRESLYNWLKAGRFSITSDGNVIAYKGVQANRLSVHSGGAFVNGEFVEGFIPNEDGSVIVMPRREVDPNQSSYCSVGLHVGAWSYVQNFGQLKLLVTFNPRDAVAVPLDYSFSKLRVCRYKVVRQVTEPIEESVV